ETPQQVRARRGEQAVVAEARRIAEAIDDREARRGTFGHRDRDSAVELDDQRRRHAAERRVQPGDPRPVGRLPGWGAGVAGSDLRLQAVRTRSGVATGAREMGEPARDARPVPAAPILILEEDDVTGTVDARGATRGLELHQREQPMPTMSVIISRYFIVPPSLVDTGGAFSARPLCGLGASDAPGPRRRSAAPPCAGLL